MLGVNIPSWMEGRSLKPLIDGKPLPPKLALSMVLEKNPVHSQIKNGTIAVWEDDYKLLYYIEKQELSLFDLKTDPYELRDIKAYNSEVADRLKGIIDKEMKGK